MITGINTVYQHGDVNYHLQSEDLGEAAGVFEVRVYDQGSVVWQKRIPYGDLSELPRPERDSALRTKMEKTLLTVEAAIAKGKLK
jgi:hypothetical protein